MLRPRWANPLPQRSNLKITYADDSFSSSLAVGGAWQGIYQFRGNSVYDPDGTGVGVQPYGYDQLTPQLFNTYKVFASKILITFTCAASIPFLKVFLVPIRASSLTYHDAADLMMMPLRKYVQWSSQSAKGRGIIKAYASTKKILPDVDGDVTLSAAYNSNPGTGWNWLLYFDTSETSTDATIKFDCKVTYYTEMIMTDSRNES